MSFHPCQIEVQLLCSRVTGHVDLTRLPSYRVSHARLASASPSLDDLTECSADFAPRLAGLDAAIVFRF
jgi:hypothetical protein